MPLLIAELNSRLENARKLYYAGIPCMSDAEYGSLEAQLKGMLKANPSLFDLAPVLTTVGTDTTGRIAHQTPMLSIQNCYTVEELCAFADSLGWPVMTIGSKLDGVSDSLKYNAGYLGQALTRGDGVAGESVLPQVQASKSIPSNIPYMGSVEVRGEIVIAQSTLTSLNAELVAKGNSPYTNARNLTAGTLKLQDVKEVARRKLLLRPWEVLYPEGSDAPDSAYQRLQDITAWGFASTDDRIVRNREELISAVEEMLETLQAPGEEISKDGLVLKVDSCALREKLGRGSKFTNFQVCYKAQNQVAETTIKSVKWQVGRQGRLTPIATVDPVILGGVKIERATLNNQSWIDALGVQIACRVSLVRSGDVIPKIVEVLEKGPDATIISPPANCPECNSTVEAHTEEDSAVTTHWCNNLKCPGRVRDMLTYVADRTVLELDGLGPELAAKLVETGMVESLPSCLSDLIQFRSDFVSSIRVLGQNAVNHTLVERGFPVILTLRMFDSIETAKTALWPNWIAAFGIPMVGRRLGKVLANKLKLQPEDLPNLPAKLAQIKLGEIDGLGVSKLGELHRFAKNPSSAELCSKLFDEGVRPTATVPASTSGARPLEGVAFFITGEFEAFGTRETITAKLEALGAISKSGVSKNVTHLLVGTDPGRSKLAKAEQLGIRQVGSEWLADKLSASLRA